MSIFDAIAAPLKGVSIPVLGTGGSSFKPASISNVTPLTIPKSSPISIASTPLNVKSLEPKPTPFDIAKEPAVTVRKQDFKDVANLPGQLAGTALQPLLDLSASLGKGFNKVMGLKPGDNGAVSESYRIPNFFQHQGQLPYDSEAPSWYKDKLEGDAKQSLHPAVVQGSWTDYVDSNNRAIKNAYQSHTLQDSYAEHIKSGDSHNKALLKTALEGGMDVAFAIPLAENFAQGLAAGSKELLKGTIPEKLIDPEVVSATRQQIRDYVSGADTYGGRESPLPKVIQEAFREATPEGKSAMIKGSGIDVATAQPSRLGSLFGITQEEADAILQKLHGFDENNARPGSAGALPGYRAKPFDILETLRTQGQRGSIKFGEGFGPEMEKVGFGDYTFKERPYGNKANTENGGFVSIHNTEGNKLGQAEFEMRGGNRAVMPVIEINEAEQSNGLGTKLMDKVEEMARERGAEKITAQAVHAPGFFAKRGYVPLNNGTTAMVKDLTKGITPNSFFGETEPPFGDTPIQRSKGEASADEIATRAEAAKKIQSPTLPAVLEKSAISEPSKRVGKPPVAIPADVHSEMALSNPQHAEALDHIEAEAQRLQDMREMIISHPARSLSKFANKNGELPEVLGHGTSKFARKGDDIVDQLGYKDSETARDDFQRYRQLTKSYERDVRAFKIGKRLLLDKMKAYDLSAGPGHELGFTDEITKGNHGVTPPRGRNDILQPPEIDFSKAKDVSTPRLTRDTMERNLEKIFPKDDAAKINRFLVEPVRENELERVKFMNDIRTHVKAKVKEFGIKAGSNDDALIQVFGEGRMTLEELRKASPKKYGEIQNAVSYFRNLYDTLLDEWNARRRVYGYSEIHKRSDYFRHFDDINEWTRQFGLIEKDSNLPTELAGKTANFKPGKPFSTAEMHRTGDRTSFSAIRGMDNYLESVGRQMFHIDSVQRGRVFGKYLDQVAIASKREIDPESGIVKPLKLSNFAANLGEWTNLVSGKAALFDRAFESLVGRPVVRFLQKIKDAFGANVIAGNISAAISHSIPISYNLATTDTVSAIRGMMDTLMAPVRPSGSLTSIEGVESSFLTRRFPVERISPSVFQNVKSTLGFVFKTVDEFISRLAVSSKYFEGKSQGLTPEAAMKRADNYAQRVIGDRSVGNLPNIMSTRSLGFITQFQVEVNDNIQVLVHDLPRFAAEGDATGAKKNWRIFVQLAKFAIYMHLFNMLYKKIKGSGKGLDPLGLVSDVFGWSDETANLGPLDRAKFAGSELLGELPFSSVVTGDYPIKQALAPAGAAFKDVAAGDFGQAGTDATKFLSEFASPVGGGSQALKTYQGIKAAGSGGTVDTKGRLKTKVDPTFGNYLKGALFGPTALNAEANIKATDLYTRINNQKAGSADLIQRAEDLDTQLQGMTPEAANKEVADISQKDPALFDKLKTIVKERKVGLTQEERLMKQLGVKNGERARYADEQIMKIQGSDEADTSAKRNTYLNDLVDKGVVTPAVLEQLKELRKEGKSLPVVKDNTTHSSSSIIDRVTTYAHAIGVDPITAFNRIFTGQTIKKVENGTVIVDRMSLSDSSSIKRSLGNNSGMILDHTIPLELGGSNDKSNLKLIPKAEAAAADKIENFIGDALHAGKINKSKAQDLMKKYKDGELTAEDVYKAVP